jgi:hypothetical protein
VIGQGSQQPSKRSDGERKRLSVIGQGSKQPSERSDEEKHTISDRVRQ